MATAFIIWDRVEKKAVGDPTLVFSKSADANTHVTRLTKFGDRKETRTFDVVTVTI